jgi:ubiquinone biosynthesis accessory factor UbiJ
MAEGLEKAINLALSLDPASNTLLKNHQGKVLQFEITSLNKRFYIRILTEKISVLTQHDDQPDTLIKGNFFAFINQVIPFAPNSSTQRQDSDRINSFIIEGDTELAHDVQRLMKNFDSHWEEYCSFFIGDTATQKMSQLWQRLSQTSHSLVKRALEDAQDYIQEEQSFVPSPEEVDDFYEEVEQLRNNIDRLEARGQRLLERKSSK